MTFFNFISYYFLFWCICDYTKQILKLHKVQLFWEGHKNVRNRPYGFEIDLVNVKTMRMIVQIFGDLLRKAELWCCCNMNAFWNGNFSYCYGGKSRLWHCYSILILKMTLFSKIWWFLILANATLEPKGSNGSGYIAIDTIKIDVIRKYSQWVKSKLKDFLEKHSC